MRLYLKANKGKAMSHPSYSADWVVPILEDLRAFSEERGLKDLAASLDETVNVARREVADLPHPETAVHRASTREACVEDQSSNR